VLDNGDDRDVGALRPEIRSRGSTVSHLVRQLREGILIGRYAPGQRLIEADLTRELGVSRGPLREAFRRLSAEGLIESIPNRGALVRRLSQSQIRELYQIRMVLEILAVELAAKNINSDGVRTRFEAEIAAIWSDRPRDVPTAYLNENKAFHQAIADASGNRQLALLCRQLQLPLIIYQVSGTLTREVIAKSNGDHRLIAEAILAGDAVTASELMRKHLQTAADFADHLPPQVFRS